MPQSALIEDLDHFQELDVLLLVRDNSWDLPDADLSSGDAPYDSSSFAISVFLANAAMVWVCPPCPWFRHFPGPAAGRNLAVALFHATHNSVEPVRVRLFGSTSFSATR